MALSNGQSTRHGGGGSRSPPRSCTRALVAVVFGLVAAASACNNQPLFDPQCGSIATATQLGDSLVVDGSFPSDTAFHLLLIITDPDTTYPHYPAILMTGTTALVPLLPAGSLPPGVHQAEWIMKACGTPDQTRIPGPKTVTIV